MVNTFKSEINRTNIFNVDMDRIIGYNIYVLFMDPKSEDLKRLVIEDVKMLVRADAEDELDDEKFRNRIDTYSFLRIKNIDISKWDMRKFLVPIWVAQYTYKGKKYYVLVNGVNGKVEGDKPLSVIKIVLVVIGVLALIGGGIFVYFKFFRNRS